MSEYVCVLLNTPNCSFVLFQIILIYCIICVSWLISGSNGLHVSENVVFQKTNEIFTSDAHWYITFVHDLKPFQGLVNKIKDDIDSTSRILHAIAYAYNQKEFVEYAETFKSLQIEIDLLTDTYQSIYRTFEDYKVLRKDNGRVKHSVLPFVGQLMSTLFGSLSELDLENINRNINMLADHQEQMVHDLDMSLSVLNMTRVQVSENRRSIMDLIICIQKLDRKIHQLQGQLQGKLTRLGQFIHTYLQFQMIFDEIKLTIQNAIFYIENLKSELNMLALNHLSTSTISPGELKVLLIEVESKLPMNYELPQNPKMDIWYFYKTLSCLTYIENDQIRIVLKIPLINTKSKYDIFKVYNIPVPFHNMTGHIKTSHYLVKYELEAEVLMVSKNRQEYALLSGVDFYMCNNHKLPLCNPKAVLYPTNMNKFCIMALFMKVEVDIKRFCKQTVMLNQKLPLAMYLSSGIWLVGTNENLKFTVSCQSDNAETTEILVKAPFDILTLNNTCRASNKYLRLLGHFEKSGTFENTDALKSLLRLRNMTHFNIGQEVKKAFENTSNIKIPSHLLNLKEIPMPMFIHGISHVPKVNQEKKTFWSFANTALIFLFTILLVVIAMYIVRNYCKSSHSFCLKRTVNEHETAVTVLKLPTTDVEESVPLKSVGGSTTQKDQTFLGQTDAMMAWPKIGAEAK